MAGSRLSLAAVLLAPLLAGGAKHTIRLGSCFSFHDAMYTPLAKVALDEGYFDDILPPNATSATFTVTVDMVNDQCDGSIATSTLLPLLLGVGKEYGRMYYGETQSSPPVAGLVGCECSGATMAVSAIGNNFKVPMVSGGATSPDLSNKGLYPYFARVVPPDSMQGAAFATVVLYYKWKRVLAAYPGDTYGQGVVSAFKAKLSASRAGVTVIEYQLPYQSISDPSTAAFFNHEAWAAVVAQVARESPQPRIFISAGNELDHMLRIFRDAGLVSNQTLWILADSACQIEALSNIGMYLDAYKAGAAGDPWWDYPWMDIPKYMRGMLCFTAKGFGAKYYTPRFQTFLSNVTRSKIEAAGWPSASEGFADVWLNRSVFEATFYHPMMFDALSAFVYAIGAMLGQGVPPDQIRGDALRDQIFASKFESITGLIAFDENGDRLAPYDIWNLKVSSNDTAYLDQVGVYDGVGDRLTWGSHPVFADGTTNVPADQPVPCNPGTEFAGAFLGCIACPLGKASISSGSTCVNCSAGYFQSSTGSSACLPAPRGAVVAGRGATNATSCPKGSYAGDRGLTECTMCASGAFADTPGMSACRLVPPGSFVSTPGAKEANPCAAGHFSAVEGAQECTSCSGGFFQDAPGQSMCNRCERGSWAPPAASNCTSCPVGMVTESAASTQATDCQCSLGQFCGGRYPNCDCRSCIEGMSCPWGAKEEHMKPYNPAGVPLLVQAHYYTKADDPLSVYFCHPSLGAGRCVGGVPESCSDLFQGLACARCPPGYAPKGDRCDPCSKRNDVVFAITPIIGVLCCIVMYYTGNKRVETNASVSMGFSVVVGLLVTVGQLLATASQLTTAWPTDIGNFFKGMRFLVVDPNVISTLCLGDSVERQYSLRFILPYCVVAAVGFCYGSAKVLEKLGLLKSPTMRWEGPKAINTVFQIYQAIFIGLTAIAVVPYQCYSHPNGESSVVQYPQVLCGGPTHGGLVAMSVVLLVTFLIPFIGVMVWASVYVTMIRADAEKSKRHLMMFRFLMFRFRPDVWWWGIPFAVRQLLLAFAPMVQPDDPHGQCVFIIAVLVVYIPAMCFFWPWKSDELNVLDAASMSFIALMVVDGTSFMPVSRSGTGHMLFMKVVLILFGIFGAMQIAYAAFMAFGKGKINPSGIFALNEQLLKRKQTLLNLIVDLYALVETLEKVPSQDLVEHLLLMNSYDLGTVQRAIAVFRAACIPIVGGSGEIPRRLIGVPSCCSAGREKERTRSRSMEFAAEATRTVEHSNKVRSNQAAHVEAMLGPECPPGAQRKGLDEEGAQEEEEEEKVCSQRSAAGKPKLARSMTAHVPACGLDVVQSSGAVVLL